MAGLTLPQAEPDANGWQKLLRLWRDKLNAILALPHLPVPGSFQVLRGLAIATSLTKIRHGLAGAPAGWLVLRTYGTTAAAVTENPGFTTATEMQFIASAACTIDLLVWR